MGGGADFVKLLMFFCRFFVALVLGRGGGGVGGVGGEADFVNLLMFYSCFFVALVVGGGGVGWVRRVVGWILLNY